MTNLIEKVRTYHEKNQNGQRTGRSITVLWRGTERYVGISQCSNNDQFSKKRGREVSYGRALHVFEVLNGFSDRDISNPNLMYSFDVSKNFNVDLPEFVYLQKTGGNK